MRTDGFFSGDVVDVGSCYAEAAGGAGETADTGAGGGDGGEVCGEGGVPEVEGAGWSYCVAETLWRGSNQLARLDGRREL